jgi:two-component system phosphate regulon sensor histidine kinase PhoR
MAAKTSRDAPALRRLPLGHSRLLELGPVGYVVSDREGVVLAASARAAELLGRPPEELVGAALPRLVGPERRARVEELVAAGAEWQDEVPFLATDGGRLRLVVHAAAEDLDQPELLWALWEVGAAPQAAARVAERLAEAHRVQRERLSMLLDRLQHAVAAVDAGLRVSYANSAAEELFGPAPRLLGSPLPEVWSEHSLRALVAPVFEHRAGPAEARVELDDRRVYDVLVLPPDASGEALVVIADVSLEERRQRAERDFVANAAHQLRTPVSAIAGAIEVLQGGAKDDPAVRDRFLAHVDRQCLRLVHLTRALLLLARAQALDEPPALEVVPLRSVLDAIAGHLRPAHGVELSVECPLDLAALANRDLLEQAVGNLAENSAKYTFEGGILLSAEPASEDRVRVVVSDTGPGADFPPDGRFHRFHRDEAAFASSEGFGLGLAIAQEAIRVLHGELRIESGSDGTRATAVLPAARVRRA